MKAKCFRYRTTMRVKVGNKYLQKCKVCKKWKPLKAFDNEKSFCKNKDGELIYDENGKRVKCKLCQKKYFKYWYEKNKEYVKQVVKERMQVKSGKKDVEVHIKTKKKKMIDIVFNKYKQELKKQLMKKNYEKLKKNRNKKIKRLEKWLA